MTIDSAIGECFDKAFNYFKKYEKVLKDQDNIQEFIDTYNAQVKKNGKGDIIPQDYFKFIFEDKMSRGKYIELLAKYGDPSEVEFPIGLKGDQNADMSFTGLKTKI